MDARPDILPISPKGRETVLLVEDDAMVRRTAEKLLRRLGYNVMSAASGNEALLISQSAPVAIDLLLTDVVMPNMNGRELAERMRVLVPRIEVLFMSGYVDPGVDLLGHIQNGASYIAKPLTVEKLSLKLREILDRDTLPRECC